MKLERLFQLVIPVILTGVVACDNVAWGGVELHLRTPRSAASEEAGASEESEAPSGPEEAPAPSGPLLGLVSTGEGEARFRPVAVLGEGGLEPLPPATRPELDRLASEGIMGEDRFVLFSRGRRVGTFFPDSVTSIDRSYCNPRPTAAGRIETLPGAGDAGRFLALPAGLGGRHPHEGFSPVSSTRAQRVASLRIAGSLYPRLGARWPPSVLNSRADLQVLRPEEQETLLAATFLYGDRLQVEEPPETAYSLFFLAGEDDGGFSPVYVRYRPVALDGKQAPRVVDHADWDGDGSDEILLEVFGSAARWFVALDPAGAGWEESYQERCPAAPVAAASPERGSGAAGGPGPVRPPRR